MNDYTPRFAERKAEDKSMFRDGSIREPVESWVQCMRWIGSHQVSELGWSKSDLANGIVWSWSLDDYRSLR